MNLLVSIAGNLNPTDLVVAPPRTHTPVLRPFHQHHEWRVHNPR